MQTWSARLSFWVASDREDTSGGSTYTQGVYTGFQFAVAAGVSGLILGSFLNVCIARVPRGLSVARPGSSCRQCGVPIRWFDNVPVVSWLLLRGRCRECQQAISWRYPAVELATALWFSVAGSRVWQAYFFYFVKDGGSRSTREFASAVALDIGFAVFGFLVIGLMVMDWQTGLLPDAFTLSGVAIAFAVLGAQAFLLGATEGQVILSKHHIQLSSPGNVVDHGNLFFTGAEAMLFGRLAATVGAAGILLLIRWVYRAMRKRDGMGLGDVKMLAMVAAFLGFWPAMLSFFVAVVTAAVYGLVMLAQGRATGASRLAFGSFLAVGGMAAALFGGRVINSYIALLQ